MFHCNSDDMSKLLMILNNTPAGCRNFEVKQAFSLDFGQDQETSTSFSHGIASIGFIRGHLKCKFPTGLGFVGSVSWICGVCWKNSTTSQPFHFIWGYFDVVFRVFGMIYVKKVHFIRHKEIVKVLSYFLIDTYHNGLHHSHSIKSYTSNQLFWSRNMQEMFARTIVLSIKKIQKNLLPYLISLIISIKISLKN